MIQLRLPGVEPLYLGTASQKTLNRAVEDAIETGILAPGCGYCQSLYERWLEIGFRIGPPHRSSCGAKYAHCSCARCF